MMRLITTTITIFIVVIISNIRFYSFMDTLAVRFSLRYAYGNVIATGKWRTIMAYRLYIVTMIV